MFELCLTLALLGADPQTASEALPEGRAPAPSLANTPEATPSQSEESPAQPLRGVQLREAVKQALRNSRHPEVSPRQSAEALLEIFGRLREDASLAPSSRRECLLLVRNRLGQLAAQIESEDKLAVRAGDSAGDAPSAGNVQASSPGKEASEIARRGRAPRGAAGGPADHGDDLVELIKSTIAPQSWDDAGGPGSIYYYRHLKVLVISQTSEIHGRVGGLLNQRGR